MAPACGGLRQHGTVFSVGVASRAEHLVTEVSVTRGSVWVLANGVQVALLGPGQHWSSDTSSVAVSGVHASAPPASVPVESATPPREAGVKWVHREPGGSTASTLVEQGHMFQEAIDARNPGHLFFRERLGSHS